MENRKNSESLEEILAYINLYWMENFSSPTIRQIRDGVGIGSVSTVWRALNVLREEGYLMDDRKRYIPHWVVSAISSFHNLD